MFHVAPYLNASPSDPQQLGRKRHIGNDVVTIVFYEGNSPLKLDFGGFIRTCTAPPLPFLFPAPISLVPKF
jgi:hypothetical protein